MRPIRLEMQGFGAFSERTEIDFTESDIFALTGPTGSGKSTVLDAICFALYGAVPRYGLKAVAPVISLRHQEARVGLEFEIAGVRYRVVRVARRAKTKTHANTDEARLEQGADLLAGTAAEVTARVEQLIGLGFGHFTTCVVLPQGEFAAFLRGKPSERQDLLVRLLGLGLYKRVAQTAAQRQVVAQAQATACEAQLAGLPPAGDADLDQARARVSAIESVLAVVETALPELEKLEKEAVTLREKSVATKAHVTALGNVVLPADLDELASTAANARSELETAHAALLEARAAETTARAVLVELPSRSDLTGHLAERKRLAAEEERLAKVTITLQEHRTNLATESARRQKVQELLEVTRVRLTALTDQHSALHLRSSIAKGDECPVCRQVVKTLPRDEQLPELADAQSAARSAQAEWELAGQAHGQAAGAEAATVEVVTAQMLRVEELTVALSEAASSEELEQQLGEVAAAEERLVIATGKVEETGQRLSNAQRAQAGLAEDEKRLRRSATELRDSLTLLAPPVLGGDDPIQDWKTIDAWARNLRPELELRAAADLAAAEDSVRELVARRQALSEVCRDAGVEVGEERIRDRVVDAMAEARRDLDAIEETRAIAASLTETREASLRQSEVAKHLARLLDARHFETWVLDEALGLLVEGANQRLVSLAGGQYSLAINTQREFEVVDHLAAGERRSAKSLSGGETFLVSLALALSLADHLAEMSTTGSNRIESMFLDEGFGTLDQDTLATVTSVIQEIASTGKTVGIVTHIRELAEQMPLRYEVVKTAASSVISVAA